MAFSVPLSLTTGLDPDAAVAALHTAAAATKPDPDEPLLAPLSRTRVQPIDVHIVDGRVAVRPVYTIRRSLGQTFRGRLVPSPTGTVLEGRITTSAEGTLLLVLATVQWVFVLLATVAEFFGRAQPAQTVGSPLSGLGVATVVLVGAWFLAGLSWGDVSRDRRHIVDFLCTVLRAEERREG